MERDRDAIEQSNSVHGIIIRILKNSDEPLSMDELLDHISRERKLNTETPKHTIRGII